MLKTKAASAVLTALLPFFGEAADFSSLAAQCAPGVHPATLRAVVSAESGFNPYAVGVVGGALKRQPASREEAEKAVARLIKEGKDFSVGLGQINKRNFARYGITAESAFDPCTNLKVSAGILTDCYRRAISRGRNEQDALRDAFSCYYAGNFTTGYREGYVKKVLSHAAREVPAVKVRPGEAPEKAKKPAKPPEKAKGPVRLQPASPPEETAEDKQTSKETGFIF